VPGEGKRTALAVLEPVLLANIEAGLERQRVVDERDNAQPAMLALSPFVEQAEGEAVDNNKGAVRLFRQPALGLTLRLRGRGRKALAQRQALDGPTAFAKTCDHPPIISIAAGLQRQIAGIGECDTLAQRSASYQPRAAWDSCRVTFRRQMRWLPGPSFLSATARASASKMCLAITSVVVTLPVKTGTSSRFL